MDTQWIVIASWLRDPEHADDAYAEQVLTDLADLHPALGVDIPKQPGREVEYAASVTVSANTLRGALASALGRIEAAAGAKAYGLEVLPEPRAAQRLAQPSIPPLVGTAEIADILGVSTKRVQQLAAEHDDFPPAVVTTKAGSLRVKAQVEAWSKTWARKVGRPSKAGPIPGHVDPETTAQVYGEDVGGPE